MENTKPSIVSSDVKLTDEEIKEIAEVRSGFEQATVAYGRLFLQRASLNKVEEQLNSEYEALVSKEKVLLDKILKKYGEGTYDPATGVFTPTQKTA